jgi:predicted TIM-barrel fold metal-dependent hydrolase
MKTTRREFLVQGTTSAAATAIASSSPFALRAADEKKMSGYIDAHVHVWTPDEKKFPVAAGMNKAAVKPDSFTPEELFAHCKPCGVDRVVLIQMSFYKYDNSYMLDAMQRFPDAFRGVGIVDPTAADVAAQMTSLAKQGVRGFRLAGWKDDPEKYFAHPGFATMWRVGAEQNLNMGLLINPDALPTIDRMCEQYPDTPVVIDHFARVGVTGEIKESELANLCKLARHKKTFVKTSAFYALGKKQAPYTDLLPMIKRVYEAFGPDRLMWASDGPFQVVQGHEYRPSVELIEKHADFLSADDRRKILRDTAARVYFG